jgi:hypothetical protein
MADMCALILKHGFTKNSDAGQPRRGLHRSWAAAVGLFMAPAASGRDTAMHVPM